MKKVAGDYENYTSARGAFFRAEVNNDKMEKEKVIAFFILEYFNVVSSFYYRYSQLDDGKILKCIYEALIYALNNYNILKKKTLKNYFALKYHGLLYNSNRDNNANERRINYQDSITTPHKISIYRKKQL